MPNGQQGTYTPQQAYGVTPVPTFGIGINWFAPRIPLVARLPKVEFGGPSFKLIGHQYRPRSLTLGAAVADGAATTITFSDVTQLMKGDVFKLVSGEYVEATADPVVTNTTTGAGTIEVRRGVSGTTAAAQADASAVVVIGNSRTGAEAAKAAMSGQTVALTQHMQTVQHGYSVGGGVQSNTYWPTAPGMATPLQQFKMDSLQNVLDDFEYSAYFGIGEAPDAAGSAGRAKMHGLRSVLTTNRTTNPADAAAYKATSFQRDLLTKPRKKGGSPGVVVISSNWMDAFAIWGWALQHVSQGQTSLGIDVSVLKAPFLGDVTLIEASLLPDFTAFSLTEGQVRWRIKRAVVDEPYGKTADASDGHMIGEMALDIESETHHAWLEGVTAFSA